METPSDINEEVKKIFGTLKGKKDKDSSSDRALRSSCSRRGSKLPKSIAVGNENQAASKMSLASCSKEPNNSLKPNSPSAIIPDVTLLHEQNTKVVVEKPIGFRPAWMIEA